MHMHSPVLLEAMAHDVMRARLEEAQRDAVAALLPRGRGVQGWPISAIRQHAAASLRALAVRLDPCVARLDAAVEVVAERAFDRAFDRANGHDNHWFGAAPR